LCALLNVFVLPFFFAADPAEMLFPRHMSFLVSGLKL
jgi:hypothetical protein